MVKERGGEGEGERGYMSEEVLSTLDIVIAIDSMKGER